MTHQFQAVLHGLAVLLLVSQSTQAGKILMLGMQFTSPLNEFAAVGEALIKSGHEVYMVMDENHPNPKWFKGTNVKFLYYKSPDKEKVDNAKLDRDLTHGIFTLRQDELTQISEYVNPRFTHDCNLTLQDQDLFSRIKQMNFDIALVEGLYFCYQLLPYKLGMPFIVLSSVWQPFLLRTHPVVGLSTCLIQGENTFFNRLQGFVASSAMSFLLPRCFIDNNLFMDYAQEKPYESLEEVYEKAELWLLNTNGVLNCPSPTAPNIIHVGGLTNKPATPLTPEYQQIVEEAKDGVIIMSFGSAVSMLPENLAEKFSKAFGQIKQKVIWRMNAKYKFQMPENVKTVSWFPQNDLLGHPNVKLFITHCGNNGVNEAIYHGKPMLGFPLFGDQGDNMKRTVVKGFAIAMNVHDFTQEELIKNIDELLTNPKYTQSVQKASEIHRSLPDPRKTSVFWIEHVMKYGGEHLRTPLHDMSIFQFLMLDIVAFILILLIIIVIILWCIVKFIFKKCTKKFSGVTKAKKTE